MNFLKDIESRIGDMFGAGPEGSVAPFSLKRLGKQAIREMERETFVIDGIDTAPALYTVLISAEDDPAVRQIYPQLAKSLVNQVVAEANRKGYVFVGTPLARFMVDNTLRAGKFAVFAENIDATTLEKLRAEEEAYLSGARQKSPKARRRTTKPTTRGARPEASVEAAAPVATAAPAAPVAPAAPAAPAVAADVPAVAPEPVAEPAAPARRSAPEPYVVPVKRATEAAPAAEPIEAPAPEPAQESEPAATPAPAQAPAPSTPVASQPLPVPKRRTKAPRDRRTTASGEEPLIPGLKPLPAVAAVIPASSASPVLPVDDSVAGLEVVPLDFLDAPNDHMGTLPKVEEEPAPQTQRRASASVAETPAVSPVMCVLIDHQAGRSYRITTTEAIVGRERKEGNVVLRDPNVSRRHAKITYDGAAWHIADLGSTNGTLVNDIDVAEQVLHDGDIITLGLMNLEFREN